MRIATLCLVAGVAACSESPNSLRNPQQTVDAYYQALRADNPALALSLLSREIQVMEHGRVNRSREDYAAVHLPTDLEAAGRINRQLMSRRSGGAGDVYWVASHYRELEQSEGTEQISNATETVLLNRRGGNWQIVHIHYSADREIPLPPEPLDMP